MTMKNTTTQNLWDAAKAVLTEKFIPIWAFFKKQTISIKQPNPPPKRIRKRANKTSSHQKEGDNKYQRGNKQ